MVPTHTSHFFFNWGVHVSLIGRQQIMSLGIGTLVKDGKFIALVPLSLKQIYKDQLKLKKEIEVERSENTSEAMSLERKRWKL